jgi:hypothetical protein
MVPTIQSCARRARRLNRLNGKVEGVLAAMRDGAVLHRLHQSDSVTWVLSTGAAVPTDTARVIVQLAEIVPLDGGLTNRFEFSQTFRYIEN